MKEKLTRNMSIKLLSLFCAFFVWLGVVNVANPTKVSTREVPVTILNAEVLEKSNLTYDVVGKKTATISFKVRTKDDYRIKASDFNAYADLSEMYDVTGAIPIRVEVVNNEELLTSAPVVKSPEVIKITTEELQTKTFALKAYPQGNPAEGYQEGTVSMVPAQIAVKGPTSLIGQISSVGIRFSIDGATSDVSGTAVPEYFDANGNVLTDLGDSVKTLGGDISYTKQILKVKDIPLDFVVTGEVAEGYRYAGPEAAVRNVSVAGLKTDLAPVSTITIQNAALNIQGATADKVCRIDLKDYVDPSLTIVGLEDTVIEVTLKVEKLTEKTFSVKESDITLDGSDSRYRYEIKEGTGQIRVRGLKEDLDSLTAGKMNLHVDVSDLGLGDHTVAVKMQLDDAFEILEAPSVAIHVTERSGASETDHIQDETEERSETSSSREESAEAN
ncbi:MAG: YbbR-like domain-containing protein [Clostridium sp.]|jgi:YbbR domain-containing protein